MRVGFDIGSKGNTALTIFCPQKGPSLRQAFVNKVMAEAGYDVVARPVPKEICGRNPVHVIVDDWPRATVDDKKEPE